MIPFPDKKYSVIYADPPWSYTAGGKQRNVRRHYHTMAPEDIFDLPVQDIAADNCLLFLWATFPNLDVALETIRRWGFKYKTATTRARVEAALAERLKARIGPNAGILADDLLDDLIAAGGVLLPVRPNGTVWVIHRRRAVSATVMFAGVGADGLAAFSVLRGRLGTTAWSSMNFTEHDIGKAVFLTREDAEAALKAEE